MKLSIYGSTNVGKQRDHNEDSFLIICAIGENWNQLNHFVTDLSRSKAVVCVVADGMGGANAGEVASSIATDTVRKAFGKLSSVPVSIPEVRKVLNSVIIDCHNNIVKSSCQIKNMQGMGTTIVIGCFIKSNLYVSWCGDSRCYVYNKSTGQELYPFTDDHSLVWERVVNHEITHEEARLSDDSNLILQSLGGSGQKPKPDFRWVRLNKKDRVVLCSDGLNSMLSNIGIQQILDYNSTPYETVESLIQAANNAGGRDNITTIVIDVIGNIGESVRLNKCKELNVTHNSKKSRSNGIFYLLFFTLVLIAALGITHRNELALMYESYLKVKPSSGVIHLPYYSDVNEINAKGDFESSEFEETMTAQISDSITAKIQTDCVTGDQIDTSYIDISIKMILEKITNIRTKIEWSKPGGQIGYNPIFYESAKPIHDSILVVVSRQEELIRNVALLTRNGMLMKVYDYTKANRIIYEIKDTIEFMEVKRENIEETYLDSNDTP